MKVNTGLDNYWENKNQKMVRRHKIALTLIEKGKVLDFGCGDGLFLKLLKARGIEGFGLDNSEVAIDKCLKKKFKCQVI